MISIIIPSRDGRKLLEENLPFLIKAVEYSGEKSEIIVVCDGDNDGTALWLGKIFSDIKVITLAESKGFSSACNHAAGGARGEYIIFINNDVKVTEDFILPLIKHFEKKDVFAVGSKEENSCEIPVASFKRGFFLYRYESACRSIPVLFVSAGHAMYDRKKFLELGGFDEIYDPFYWEDMDICARAWQKGWKVIYEPESRVYHNHQSTVKKFYSQKEISAIHWCHRFLFMWKNLDDRILRKHRLWIPIILTGSVFLGRPEILRGYIRALKAKNIKQLNEEERISITGIIKRFYPGYYRRRAVLYLHETSRISGAENSLLHLVKFIDKNKFYPVFILPAKGHLHDKLNSMGISVDILEFPRIRNGNIYRFAKTIIGLKRLVAEKYIEIIHSQSIRTHIYGAIAGKLTGVSVVWHERNLITDEKIDLDRLFSFLPDRIVCNSKAIAKRFLRKGTLSEKVKVIYNGVDTERFNPSIDGERTREELCIKPDSVVIGIVSRFSPDKGHDTFLEAAKIILDDAPENRSMFKFLIAGGAVFDVDIWRERELKEKAKKLGIEGNVIFTGFRDDMPQIYAAMDIVVLASHAEPCGRVIFESMAMGKAIIGTNTGGTPEIIADKIAGLLVPPKKADILAEAILSLVRDKKLILRMGEAGRKRAVEDFNIKKNVNETERLYDDLFPK